jgi:O-methyltransferase involved in polyketide biosynthesis
MVNQIDYDFSTFDKEWMTQLVVAIRTEILDRETKAFIARHPDAIVINLGCGLDTRFFRIDDGKIHWYNLDLPEPIKVKKILRRNRPLQVARQIRLRLFVDRRHSPGRRACPDHHGTTIDVFPGAAGNF